MVDPSSPDPLAAAAGRWLWLFPAVFAVHAVEEGLAGEGFGHSNPRASGREVGTRTFFAVNLAFEVAMVTFVRQATDAEGLRARPTTVAHRSRRRPRPTTAATPGPHRRPRPTKGEQPGSPRRSV